MTNKELYKKTFDHLACPEMNELEVQMIMNEGKKHISATRKILAAVLAVVVAFALSNVITYAANGEAWITGLWNHSFVYNLNSGKEDMDKYEFKGDGYYIQVLHADVYDKNGNVVTTAGGGGIENVNIINEDARYYLSFGQNKFDITDQINEKGFALMRISISDRVMVCAIRPMGGEARSVEDLFIEFYDYEFAVETEKRVSGDHRFVTIEEIEAAPMYYAK